MIEERLTIKDEKFPDFIKNDRNGWIICAASILLSIVRNGITYTFGLYIKEFRRLHKSPMAMLSWISVTALFVTFSFSWVCSLIIRRYPNKGHMITSLLGTLFQAVGCLSSSFVIDIPWLFLTYGILYGIGCCYTLMASTLILNDFFPKNHQYHVFATSIYQCSCPAGILIFSTFYAWIIDNYSWRWSMRVAALKIFVLGIICSLLFLLEKPVFKDDQKLVVKCKTISQQCIEICECLERVCWPIGVTLILTSQFVAFANLPHYLEERGFKTMASSLSITLIAIFELIIDVIVPIFGKRLQGNLIYTNIISCLCLAVLFFIWPFVNPSYGVVLTFSAVIGICRALSFVFIYPGSAEAMDMDSDVAWTITCTVCGLGALLGPLISGVVYDYSHTYDTVFFAVASVCFLDFLSFASIPLVKFCKRQQYECLD